MRVGEEERYVEVAEVRKVYRSGTAEAIEAVSSVGFTVARGEVGELHQPLEVLNRQSQADGSLVFRCRREQNVEQSAPCGAGGGPVSILHFEFPPLA